MVSCLRLLRQHSKEPSLALFDAGCEAPLGNGDGETKSANLHVWRPRTRARRMATAWVESGSMLRGADK